MLGGLPGCLGVVFIFDVTKMAGRGFEFFWVVDAALRRSHVAPNASRVV